MRLFTQKGQSLFEVLVAVALAALIVTAIASLATKSIGNTLYARNQSEATKLAQNGIEYVRYRRDKNPEGFFDNSDRPSESDMNSEINCTGIFTCNLTINVLKADEFEILVDVSWIDGSGTHSVTSKTYLTNYGNI